MVRVEVRLAFIPALLAALLFVGCTAATAGQPVQAQPSAAATTVPESRLAVVRFYVPTVT